MSIWWMMSPVVVRVAGWQAGWQAGWVVGNIASANYWPNRSSNRGDAVGTLVVCSCFVHVGTTAGNAVSRKEP